jgi:tetratricopeptide (TPR) repeat protein
MRALALHESLAERWPDHPGVLDDLCWSYERVSTMHSQLDDPDAAREYARKAVRVGEDLIRRWPERSLSHHAARGALLRYYATFQSDDDPESWLALDMASKFAEEALRLEPDRLDFIHARARVRQNFVEHFLRTGMHAEAAANARAMLADAERLARENPARRDLIEMSCRARVLLAEAFAAACHSEELENAVRSGARMIFNEYPDTRYPELLDEALCYLYRLFDRSQQMRAIPRL